METRSCLDLGEPQDRWRLRRFKCHCQNSLVIQEACAKKGCTGISRCSPLTPWHLRISVPLYLALSTRPNQLQWSSGSEFPSGQGEGNKDRPTSFVVVITDESRDIRRYLQRSKKEFFEKPFKHKELNLLIDLLVVMSSKHRH